jgi:hypothetical protein
MILIVEMEYPRKDYDPARPTASSVKNRLDIILDAVIHLYIRLEAFTDMSPKCSNEEAKDSRQNVNNKSKIPGDARVSSCPKQPGFNVVFNITTVLGRVRLVPEEVDEQSRCNEQARDDGGTNKRPKSDGEESDKNE